MDDRKRRILRAVIDNYIHSAEPVGSKTLAAEPGLAFSPATLRNEMAALEEQGYLEQPHTSAGRVPTPLGYRLYVDELMESRLLPRDEQETINRMLHRKIAELDRLLSQAGRLMSDLTHYAAVTSSVRPVTPDILKLELFPADPLTLVMVAVLDGGLVKTKLARLDSPAREEHIHALAAALSGQRNPLLMPEQELRARAGGGFEYWEYVREFLQALSGIEQDVYVSGQAQLLSHPEFHDLLRARRTIEYITERRSALMSQTAHGPPGVRITIGPENIAAELADASVVMASYQMGDSLRGVIGVIGPTRMDYGRLIPRLRYFAAKLEQLAQNDNDNDDA